MELAVHQILAGLATGGIYAAMALAIVMIYSATGHLNFAQSEMAMLSAFVAWQLLQWGVPYWFAFAATVAISFAGGFAIERIAFAPLRQSSALTHVAVFIALFSIFNGLAAFIWDYGLKTFPSPFGTRPLIGSGLISAHDAGMLAVVLLLLIALHVFLRYTRAGLAMRAVVANREAAALMGMRTDSIVALGWGMAAAIGAVAAMMIAPIVFLEPNMMVGILVYGFAGAVLGGLNSPFGAALGGFAIGVIENLAGTFVPVIGRELKLPLALALIVAVLIIKPQGLMGRARERRI
jgi:branched-chain amino acid transport system permease protein